MRSILVLNQKKATTNYFRDLNGFYQNQEDLVNELIGNGIGACLLMKIIEKRLRLPEGVFISYVSPKYRDVPEITEEKSVGTKKEVTSVVFHCCHKDGVIGMRMKFERSPQEIFQLINTTGVHYTMVAMERCESTSIDFI